MIVAGGASFVLREWAHGPNGGPPLHMHHNDDEAWHVLEGTLRFRFVDREIDATAGTTVFAPAGVAHTFGNPGPGGVRYIIVMTQRIVDLIDELHSVADRSADELAEVYRKYDAEIME